MSARGRRHQSPSQSPPSQSHPVVRRSPPEVQWVRIHLFPLVTPCLGLEAAVLTVLLQACQELDMRLSPPVAVNDAAPQWQHERDGSMQPTSTQQNEGHLMK